MKTRLSSLREYVDKTQEEIAKVIGVKQELISQWEVGKKTISLDRLNIYALILMLVLIISLDLII